jgi:hypothetical protein
LLDGVACTCIAVSPADNQVLYVGTFAGVFRSRDGGASWQSFSPGITKNTIVDLLVDPNDARLVYAATQFDRVYVIEQSDVAAQPTTTVDSDSGCAMNGKPRGAVEVIGVAVALRWWHRRARRQRSLFSSGSHLWK